MNKTVQTIIFSEGMNFTKDQLLHRRDENSIDNLNNSLISLHIRLDDISAAIIIKTSLCHLLVAEIHTGLSSVRALVEGDMCVLQQGFLTLKLIQIACGQSVIRNNMILQDSLKKLFVGKQLFWGCLEFFEQGSKGFIGWGKDCSFKVGVVQDVFVASSINRSNQSCEASSFRCLIYSCRVCDCCV